MKKHYLIKITILLLLFGCNSGKEIPMCNSKLTKIDIPLQQKDNILNFSDLVDSLTYIPLQTDSNCLIGSIDKLIVLEDRFLILDKEIACAVYSFDKKGNFINRIGNRGMGDKEYVSLTDIAFDSSTNEICMWDGDGKRFLIYSLDGHFIKNLSFNYIVENITYVGKHKLACFCDYAKNHDFISSDKYPNLLIYDTEEHTFETGLYFESSICRTGITSLINNFSNSSYLILPLNDTIYNISHKGINPLYYLNFGAENTREKRKYVQRLNEETVDAQEAMEIMEEKALFPSLLNFLQGTHVSYFFYRKQRHFYYGFYYPQSGSYLEASQKYTVAKRSNIPINNDIDDTYPFIPIAVEGDDLYYTLDPSSFEDLESRNANFNDLRQRISPEDNPILVVASMKIY